ncbi:MAG: hypothetical protein P8X47_08415 [Ignavibacteriaceae bacterium]|jgi:hypothetical protein
MFQKFYNIFNYTSIAVVVVFLVLILAKLVSPKTYVVLLVITLVIFLARIGLRIYLHSYLKKNREGE